MMKALLPDRSELEIRLDLGNWPWYRFDRDDG